MITEEKITKPLQIIYEIFFNEKTPFFENHVYDGRHVCRPVEMGIVWTSLNIKSSTCYMLQDYNFKQNEKNNKTSY